MSEINFDFNGRNQRRRKNLLWNALLSIECVRLNRLVSQNLWQGISKMLLTFDLYLYICERFITRKQTCSFAEVKIACSMRIWVACSWQKRRFKIHVKLFFRSVLIVNQWKRLRWNLHFAFLLPFKRYLISAVLSMWIIRRFFCDWVIRLSTLHWNARKRAREQQITGFQRIKKAKMKRCKDEEEGIK